MFLSALVGMKFIFCVILVSMPLVFLYKNNILFILIFLELLTLMCIAFCWIENFSFNNNASSPMFVIMTTFILEAVVGLGVLVSMTRFKTNIKILSE